METTAYTGSTRWPELIVNKIEFTEPFEWLSKGWKDMRDAGWHSLMYGAGIVLISGLLTFGLFATDNLFLLPFLVAGFFLIAPFLGIGLYQMSAHLERGEPLKACNALEAWKSNHTQISIITVAFLIITQLWIASNFILFALLYEGISPPINNFISNVFLSEKGMVFSIASITVGFLFAWCAFAISVITVPMLIDRKVDGFTAIRISIKTVLKNMPAMMLWAFMIVVIVGLGLMTYYVGLIVALPLIGHGSWHAYRSLVPSA
ncbi:MAG: DUF2189 domain-containing protein [Candidatus Thiodiazotropha sp. (ex Lucinoma borealis)]|nr:DUF2189 domain-containing protein [Candidatus Thiodiazotropha sp. (ex Lucinoma borealis)]MCU7838541.1 DUF2189 domain-containing protein [Candidatus Thiodiazotropha sp. (ex Troendleina suluensis)]MCU7866800.1 DUF2189 domain-containing protein [Candidatus Thiodiazotropha sp. (ex Lucinoma borealis)]MCU7868630.1 DUF2189 domain-containing protein [Candidatus Thiodiazotropha sp. (ex Lucinoma borealis)]